MKSIGIVICNYNKCDYILKCIQSVLESRTKDFDVYVVDNASTDESVVRIRESYGNQVQLIINQENLGGSGGFNAGIRRVLEKNYEYLMCLDNDVQVDEEAIESLQQFLKENPRVGMVGSKVYHMDSPEYIQQFGLNIDFEHFTAQTLYLDTLDTEEIPEVVYCDTVAACSVMLPVEVVRRVGLLPEDNFLYWDDMEWGYLVKKNGYQVAAYGKSRVLHAMGAMNRRNTSFSNYYQWRNYFNFFMKYTPEDKLEDMSVRVLSTFFSMFYESMYREEHEVTKTLMFALSDAVSGIRGKAAPEKIIPNQLRETAFQTLILHSTNYWLEEEDKELSDNIQNLSPNIKKVNHPSLTDLRIKRCSRIIDITDYSLEYCYLDDDLNIAWNEEDIQNIRNYRYSLQLFLYMQQSPFLYSVNKMREKAGYDPISNQ